MQVLGAGVDGADPGAGVGWPEVGHSQAVIAWTRPGHVGRRVLSHVVSLVVVARHLLQGCARTVATPRTDVRELKR